MSKKHKITTAIILIVLIMFGGNWYYQNHIKVKNVFDQMYYSRVRNSFNWMGSNRGTMFGGMEQVRNISRDEELSNTDNGIFRVSYKEEFLNEGEVLTLIFYREERYISFFFSKEMPDSDEVALLEYVYNVGSKDLTVSTIETYYRGSSANPKSLLTEEDMEEFLTRNNLTKSELDELQESFLYDKILVDFLEHNEGKTRFSIDNLGKFEVVEGTVNK